MKKFRTYVMLALVAMMVAFVSSCSKVPKYAKLIPDDAPVVVSMDINKGAKSTGVDNNSDLKSKIKKQIKDSGVSKKLSNLMCEIVDDPAKLGLDLRDPLLFALASKNDPVLTGAVYNAEDFTEVLNQIAKENDGEKVKQKGDYWLFNIGSTVLVYNKDWFYLGDKKFSQDVDDYFDDVKDLFEKESTKGTMLESENMKAMCSADGFVQMLVQLKGFSDMREIKEVAKSMPDGIELDDIAILADFNIDGTDITLTGEVISEKKETKEKLDQYMDYLKDINQNMLQYCDAEGAGMFWNVDFQKAMEVSDISNALKMLGEDTRKDVKKIMESIVGEGVIACNSIDMENGYPYISAYCKVSDDSFIKVLEKNLGEGVTSEGTHKYSFPVKYVYGEPSFFTFFGYDSDVMYCVTGEKGASLKPAKKPLSADYAKGKGLYAYLSAKFVTNALKEVDNPQAKVCKDIADLFTFAELYYESGTKGVLKLHAKNADFVSSLIKTITNAVEELQSAPAYNEYEDIDTVAVYDDYAYADSVAYDEYDY